MKKAAVIGAGVMGTRICRHFLKAGYRVALVDRSDEALEKARDFLNSPGAPVQFATRLEALGDDWEDVEAVFEAVPERLELKHQVLRDLEDFFASGTIIASNTSGLRTDDLIRGMTCPGRFLIAHFFNPADLIPAVEVVPGAQTREDVTDRMVRLLEASGKKVARLNTEVPGFIANRLQHAMLRECFHLIGSGVADAATIDLVTRYSIGVRLALIGPMLQRDLNGLDTHLNIASYLYPELDARQSPPDSLAAKVEAGELGRKTGQGFYAWDATLTQRMDEIERMLPQVIRLAAAAGEPEEDSTCLSG